MSPTSWLGETDQNLESRPSLSVEDNRSKKDPIRQWIQRIQEKPHTNDMPYRSSSHPPQQNPQSWLHSKRQQDIGKKTLHVLPQGIPSTGNVSMTRCGQASWESPSDPYKVKWGMVGVVVHCACRTSTYRARSTGK